MPNLVGQTLGRYRIVARLGQGGMAEVYKAYHPGLDRYVAVKVMHSHLANDPDFVSRFEREARSVYDLRHPNIVQVFDFDSQDGMYYMVMEFVEGPSLKAELEERSRLDKPFSQSEVGRLMVTLGEAIDFAHGRGMVHRDLKPANFMLTKAGQILILDFGIARIIGETQYTITGAVTGTPAYMSPEQGQGQRGDERSDIYSLGIILYQMIVGEVPYNADTPLAVILKHINEPLPVPRQISPVVPENIERVILKSLSKDPADRYQSGAEFADAIRKAFDLSETDNLFRHPVVPIYTMETVSEISPSAPTFQSGRPTQERTAVTPEGGTPTLFSDDNEGPTRASPPPPLAEKQGSRLWMIAAIIAVVLLLGGGGFFVIQGQQQAAVRQTMTAEAESALAMVSQTETAESVVLKAAVIDTPTATDPPNTEATLDALLDARATTAAVALTADAPTATNTALVTDTPASTDTPAADTPTPTETPTPNTPDPTETPVASLAVDTPTPTLEPTETPTALPTTTPTLAGPTDTPVPTSTPTTAPTSTSSAPPVSGRIAVPVDNGLGGYNVVVYNVPDGQQLGRIENGHQPAFRADGVKLVVNGEGGGQDNVWEVNGQNYQYERAVSGSPSDFHPFYSPAGDRLVVGNANLAVGTDGNTHPYIFVQCGVRNPQEEGDDRCREVANFGILVPNGQIGEIHGSNPVWTGSDLIVYKGCNTWEGGNSCGIFQVGSWANKRSSNGVTPSKIPGIDGTDTIPTGAFGNSFLYHDRKNDDWEVYLSSVSGGIVNLSNGPGSVDALGAFSPDGQWVAFVSNRDGAWSIWVVAADGGPPSKLFELPWGAALRDWQNERLSWAP